MTKLGEEQKAYFKEKLENELKNLDGQLKDVGRINPDNPRDWQPVPEEHDAMRADKNEVADNMEDYEENTAIVRELEIRYNQVKRALGKIEDGTYGTCEVGGEPIDPRRLEANPAAMTCVAHTDSLRPE